MNLEQIKERAKKLYKQGTRLDNQGRRPHRVEKVLQRAISMDPFNLAYHRRRICHLLKANRVEEAQEAWACAMDLLRCPDGDCSKSFYILLHKEVAEAAVTAGANRFAVDILNDIPENILRGNKEIVQLVMKASGSKTKFRRTVK